MTLTCCACLFIEGRGDTEAITVIAGFAVCEDHQWVRSHEGLARAIVEAVRNEAAGK